MLNQFGSQLEVSAYLQSGFQASNMKPVVEGFPDVVTVTPVSKEEAWAETRRGFGHF